MLRFPVYVNKKKNDIMYIAYIKAIIASCSMQLFSYNNSNNINNNDNNNHHHINNNNRIVKAIVMIIHVRIKIIIKK